MRLEKIEKFNNFALSYKLPGYHQESGEEP